MIALLAGHGALWAGIGSFLLGVGLGALGTTMIVAIQASVPWSQRGVATASNMLMRIVGNALGAALLGGVLNLEMAHYLRNNGLAGRVSMENIRDLMGEPTGGPRLAPEVLSLLRDGLSGSLHLVFWAIALFALVTLFAAWRVPELDPANLPDEASMGVDHA